MDAHVESIVAAFRRATPSSKADFDIVLRAGSEPRFTHLAVSRQGIPSLLIPVPRVLSEAVRLTHGVAISAAKAVDFLRAGEHWRCPAVIVECRDEKLLQTFAAMAAALIARIEGGPPPSWESVTVLLSEWERLLSRRQLLSGESELGLWGELWCVARSRTPEELLRGWRGPEGERFDFFLDGVGLEVKVARRPGVHFVAQAQVDGNMGEAQVVFMSMHAMIEPLHGLSLRDLVREVAQRASDVAELEEKLAAVGYSRDDELAYSRRYVLMDRPRLYRRERVPRVRTADPGVSELRYRVELAPDLALDEAASAAYLDTFGLNDSFAREFPCA